MKHLRECFKRYHEEKKQNGHKQSSGSGDMPTVMSKQHPNKKEKQLAERDAMKKRIKGQKPDHAADSQKQAEAGKAGSKRN